MNANSKTLTPAVRKCYVSNPPDCDETYTLTIIDQASGSLPSFMDLTGTTLTATPTIASHIGTYDMELTMTTTTGTSPVYVAAVVTITCTISSIPDPTPPATVNYYIYDPSYRVDLTSTVYTQVPPCEYPATNDFSWTIPSAGTASITEEADMILSVVSNDKTDAGEFDVILHNTLTYDSVDFVTEIPFRINVLDPCATTTIHTVTITTMTVVLGEEATQTFSEAGNVVEDNFPNLKPLCGTRVYVVVDQSDTPVSWMSVTGTEEPYTITAAPTDESFIGD